MSPAGPQASACQWQGAAALPSNMKQRCKHMFRECAGMHTTTPRCAHAYASHAHRHASCAFDHVLRDAARQRRPGEDLVGVQDQVGVQQRFYLGHDVHHRRRLGVPAHTARSACPAPAGGLVCTRAAAQARPMRKGAHPMHSAFMRPRPCSALTLPRCAAVHSYTQGSRRSWMALS